MLTYLEPEWRAITELPLNLPKKLYSCLTAEDSLTTRLRELGELRVEVIKEYTEKLQGVEVWQRDVILLIDNVPCIIGHSVISLQSLTDPLLQRLKKLGTRPLGEVIFSELKGTRELLEYADIGMQHDLFHLVEPYIKNKENTLDLYARRSIVKIDTHKLIVHEIFLPQFLESTHDRAS